VGELDLGSSLHNPTTYVERQHLTQTNRWHMW